MFPLFSLLRITALAAVAAGLAFTSAARADVIYRVEAAQSGTTYFDATLTQTSFITSSITVPISDFAVAVNSTSFTSVAFSVAALGNEDGTCAEFGQSSPCDSITIQNLTVGNGSAFIVPLGALETPGVYPSFEPVIPAFSWTLTVSAVSATPEPASLAVLAMGLAGLGVVLRTRRT